MDVNIKMTLGKLVTQSECRTVYRKAESRKNADIRPAPGISMADYTFKTSGIVVEYPLGNQRQWIFVQVDVSRIIAYNKIDSHESFIKFLDYTIKSYFDNTYDLFSFTLREVTYTNEIYLPERKLVEKYLRHLSHIRRIQFFNTPRDPKSVNKYDIFFRGVTKPIEFKMSDIESYLLSKTKDPTIIQFIDERYNGVIYTSVKITKQQWIRDACGSVEISPQIEHMIVHADEIYMNVFHMMIPKGDSFKKEEALKVIEKNVPDKYLRRSMIRLLELVPEAKSLHLAQRQVGRADLVRDIMNEYERINLSPIAISKREEDFYLPSIYYYLSE